jgi:ATP-dependent Lon protease
LPAFLAVSGAEDRLIKATEIFNKRSDISEVSSKISHEVGESLSKQQKEYFLRQQLQAIQKELTRLNKPAPANNLNEKSASLDAKRRSSSHDLDDEQDENEELVDLRKKIETMRPGSEERKMAAREWKRLKRIPAGSVENGVIRTYVCIPILEYPLNP